VARTKKSFEEAETNICSTAACAMGHAALHPWFQDRGLKLVANLVYETDEYPDSKIIIDSHTMLTEVIKNQNELCLDDFSIEFDDKDHFTAAAEFFKISYDHASTLFYPETGDKHAEHWALMPNYTAAEVAARIRAYVKAATGEDI